MTRELAIGSIGYAMLLGCGVFYLGTSPWGASLRDRAFAAAPSSPAVSPVPASIPSAGAR